ncbi:aminoglycoside phosphotransferase [Anaerocolumna cellulosilytica]|uniref:Aminoglycoside phosphotransferase n=1 Tax=Anaerocolumna cellulosilytica TaxID=433286 RepID=A0A6S6QY40_9FIRM|nr:phosphotransferase [Anaerocolumna cellulosilytica]MBB5195040.1 Ser/Thr protein kinase RdoA (MazF antagonist) [Anaerocolumna cellulosilytica]BCJ96123.1 aminoglycoside phosphotransferase [Anaerocolumna cellulosilytica]
MNTKYKEDIKEYYKFAQKVLKEYEICYDDISFLQQSENITFCIEKKSSEEKYLVRIHKSIDEGDEYQNNISMINSELLLLEKLNACELFTVQAPVKNRYNSFVTRVFNESLGKDLNVTVLRWIDGDTIDINNEKYNGLALKLGEEMAKLHKYSNQCETSEEFIRIEHDLETSKTNLLKLDKLVDINILSKMKFDEIYKCAINIIEFIKKNLSKNENWGLIHGDLNECNYIVNGNEIFLIDFSRCGFGYYLYDIALTLMHLSNENRRLFIKGYKNISLLPNDYEKMIESFFVLSVIDNMLFLSSNPEEYDYIKNMVNYLCDYVIRKYKNNDRFIFVNN